MITIIQVLLGIVVLISGRKLFWLFVGVVGFAIGAALAAQYISADSEVLKLLIALGAGILGAVLALFLQRLAVGAAGFVVGGYGLTAILDAFGIRFGLPFWVLFLVGGILGAVLVAVLFDWALILLSSLAGADMIVRAIDVSLLLRLLLILLLVLAGVGIQAAIMRSERAHPRPPASSQAPIK
jgi:pimeloyl-ACP methyl ester carboxylesterase